jgi:hypothetical protein
METSIDKFQTQIRLIKVYYTHSSKYGRFPRIHITGKYLKEFDFEIGDTIELKIETGRITITKLSTVP